VTRPDPLTATEPEIAALFLHADVIVDCATGRLADVERLRVHIGSHWRGLSGPGYKISTEKYGCRWSNAAGTGVLGWPELWRYATAAATPARVDAACEAYAAYTAHVVHGERDEDVYDRVTDALTTAAYAIVLAAPDPDVQLDLFGGAS
jgi:hypothetical protein